MRGCRLALTRRTPSRGTTHQQKQILKSSNIQVNWVLIVNSALAGERRIILCIRKWVETGKNAAHADLVGSVLLIHSHVEEGTLVGAPLDVPTRSLRQQY